MDINRIRLKDRKICLVVSSIDFESDDELLDFIALALDAGVDIIQFKEQHFNARKIIDVGKKIRELCSIYDSLFIVNSRVDIARIVKADGVHLDINDVDVCSAKSILDPNSIVGLSIPSLDQVHNFQGEQADYLCFCPVDEIDDVMEQPYDTEFVNDLTNIPVFVSKSLSGRKLSNRVIITSAEEKNALFFAKIKELSNKLK